METTLTRKGQVAIPKRLRDALGLRIGTKLRLEVSPEGEIRLLRQAEGADCAPDRYEPFRATNELRIMLRSDG
jgi:AbrB family looped-hinge helix DNA binding protein